MPALTATPIRVTAPKPPVVRPPKPKLGAPSGYGSPLAAAAAGTAPDPYSGMLPGAYTPQQIQQLVKTFTGGYPAGLTPTQIQQQATGEISPLVAAATKAIQDQAASNAQGIKAVTDSLAQQLAGVDYGAPYQQAEQGQAAVDAALQASLNNAGSTDAADLGKRLAALNDPSVAQAAGEITQNAGANATTQVAQGSSALANLIADQAAASEYGKQQPGIARQLGIQQLGTNAQNATSQIAQQTQQYESMLPSIIQQLTSESDQNAASRAQAGTSLFTTLLGQSASNQTNRAQLAEDWAKYQGAQAAATAQAEGKDAAQVQAAAIKAETAARTAAAKASQPSSSLTRANGYLTANDGTPILDRNGNLRPVAGYKVNPAGSGVVSTKQTKQSGGLTANEISSDVQAWHDGKPTSVRVPATDKSGNPVYDVNGAQVYTTKTGTSGSLTYPQALRRLVALGVDRQQALQALDSAWKRGEGGRAWLTNNEQAVLRNAGATPKARLVNGHGVLNGRQVQALRLAGKLPAGQETADGFYVIAQTF